MYSPQVPQEEPPVQQVPQHNPEPAPQPQTVQPEEETVPQRAEPGDQPKMGTSLPQLPDDEPEEEVKPKPQEKKKKVSLFATLNSMKKQNQPTQPAKPAPIKKEPVKEVPKKVEKPKVIEKKFEIKKGKTFEGDTVSYIKVRLEEYDDKIEKILLLKIQVSKRTNFSKMH